MEIEHSSNVQDLDGALAAPKPRDDSSQNGLLGGSGVAISGATSPLIWVISIVTLLITLLITTNEPPSES